MRTELTGHGTQVLTLDYTSPKKTYRSHNYKRNLSIVIALAVIVLALAAAYLFVGIEPGNSRLMEYALRLRRPKLVTMLVAAIAIGGSTLVFQSIINNTIVTPGLLGMNSLYSLIHTAVVFFAGTGSVLATNANLSFVVDLALMGITATVIYSYFFRKTQHNILYVLLIGTVLSGFFSSIQSTLVRVMDPNEFESIQNQLVASFSNVNSEIILASIVLLAAIVFFLRKDLALLDVITLGKAQATNLGVDYDRTIRRLLVGVVLSIAIATAMVGPISFLGLIIANLARQLLQTFRHKQLIAGSILIGMMVLIGGQLIVEHIFINSVPISVFITVGGGIYFLFLILRRKRA